MATKKVYPFINARIAAGVDETLEDHVITFDAREVAYYHRHEGLGGNGDIVTVGFKSGKEIDMYLGLDEECYPDDNLITRIDLAQYTHFWHDNEDSTPNEDED